MKGMDEIKEQVLGEGIANKAELARRFAELMDEWSNETFKAEIKAKTIAWYLPQAGLLGTLIGLGAALGMSDSILSATNEIDAVIATQLVNANMRVAFDTTIVGVLAMCICMMAQFVVLRCETALYEMRRERTRHRLLEEWNN